jgi:hypothetical protein
MGAGPLDPIPGKERPDSRLLTKAVSRLKAGLIHRRADVDRAPGLRRRHHRDSAAGGTAGPASGTLGEEHPDPHLLTTLARLHLADGIHPGDPDARLGSYDPMNPDGRAK